MHYTENCLVVASSALAYSRGMNMGDGLSVCAEINPWKLKWEMQQERKRKAYSKRCFSGEAEVTDCYASHSSDFACWLLPHILTALQSVAMETGRWGVYFFFFFKEKCIFAFWGWQKQSGAAHIFINCSCVCVWNYMHINVLHLVRVIAYGSELLLAGCFMSTTPFPVSSPGGRRIRWLVRDYREVTPLVLLTTKQWFVRMNEHTNAHAHPLTNPSSTSTPFLSHSWTNWEAQMIWHWKKKCENVCTHCITGVFIFAEMHLKGV